MKLICMILCLVIFPPFAQAKNLSAKEKLDSDVSLRHKMNDIYGNIKQLGPYIASEQEFVNSKNSNFIQNNLLELIKLFKNLKSHSTISTQGLSINQIVMAEQLEQTVYLLKTEKRSLARAKLTAALNLCVNCHTQSHGKVLPKLFHENDVQSMKLTHFEKAEIYFIGRDYDKAIPLYDAFIKKSKKTDNDEFIVKALERELVYYVKIKKNFQEGKSLFDKYLSANLFNDKVKVEVTEWSRMLGEKGLWENYNSKKTKEVDMEKFMNSFIVDNEEGPIFTVTNSSIVYDLNLSTILLDYYNSHPKTPLGGKILYWLAILDKRINDDLYFSLGDYYLLTCMEKYSKDPVAHDCFDIYQEELEMNYITKDRKIFPPHIIEKLNSLKKQINYLDEK